MTDIDGLRRRLAPFRQQHLLQFWDQLDDAARRELGAQIAGTDFAALERYVSQADGAPDWGGLARRAQGPRAIRLQGPAKPFGGRPVCHGIARRSLR